MKYLCYCHRVPLVAQIFNTLIDNIFAGDRKFVSATYRLFKLPRNDSSDTFDVTYKGTCENIVSHF